MPKEHWPSLFGVVLLILMTTTVSAQNDCALQLRGRVLDEHDRSPLSFAEILLIDKAVGAVAGEDGRFVLEKLCPGEVRLRIAHLGCTPIERTVILPREGEVILLLEHHAHELHEFEVARARPDEHVGQATQALDKEAMDRSAGRSLAEMLAVVPGVRLLNSGPTITKPIIHGLSGNRILVLNQGIRQEDQQWGTEHAPNLDPFSTDHVTVVKGAASVQYGSDALGGVIITEPIVLPRDTGTAGEVAFLGALNGLGTAARGRLQGGVNGWKGFGWRLQGSGRYMGDVRSPDYVLSNTGLREAAGSASFGYQDHARSLAVYYSYFQRRTGILRAAHIGNLTDLRNAIDRGRPWYVEDHTYAIQAPQQTAAHHLVKVDAGLAVADRGKLVGTYGYQSNARQEFDRRRGGRDAIPALDLDLSTHTADLVFKHWLGREIHGKVGVNGVRQTNVNVPGTGVRPLIPNYVRETVGVFLVEHMPVNERLEVEAGARLEGARLFVARYDGNDVLVQPRHSFVNHALSAGFNWSVRDSLRIRFNLGTAYRPPHVSELYSEGLHHGAAAIELGDDRLQSERSTKATLNVRSASKDGSLVIDVSAYHDHIGNYIYLRPDGFALTIRGAFPSFRYVATDVRLIGMDVALNYRPHHRWLLNTTSSTVRGRDMRLDEWLFQMPADRLAVSVARTLGNGTQRTAEIALTAEHVVRQRRVPFGLDYMEAPDAYTLMGVSGKVSVRFDRGVLHLGCTAANILDARYRDVMDRFRYYTDAIGLGLDLWVRYEFGGRTMGTPTL